MGRILSCIFLSLFLQTSFTSAKLPDWVTQEMIDMVANDKAKCMAEHGTTQDLIDAVNDGNIPNDPKITCYMYCLFESFSVIDEDGQLEAEMLAGLLPENIQAKGIKILQPCATPEAITSPKVVIDINYWGFPDIFQGPTRHTCLFKASNSVDHWCTVENIDGADNCEKVYKIATCISKADPSLWFML